MSMMQAIKCSTFQTVKQSLSGISVSLDSHCNDYGCDYDMPVLKNESPR